MKQIVQQLNDEEHEKIFIVENKNNKEKFCAISQTKCDTEKDEEVILNKINAHKNNKYLTILDIIGYNYIDFDSNPYPTIITEYLPNRSLYDLISKEESKSTTKFIVLFGVSLAI